MRGSMNNQIMCALKAIARIGESRHEAKKDHGGMSPYIHSVGTMERTFYRLRPLGQWLREHGVKNLEELTSGQLSMYLRKRWHHHMEQGNARATFRQELSAVAALERGLTVFSLKHREKPVEYEFQRIRKMYSRMARVLPARTSEYEDRTANELQWLFSCIEEEKHRLMAGLQIEAGCRAEGVGAPRKGSNPFSLTNLCDPDTGEPLGIVADPVTGRRATRLWTREKGGKVAVKYCSVGLGKRLKRFLEDFGPLEEKYETYLGIINQALKETGQHSRGKGTHSLRYAFARCRYGECLREGLSDEGAKQQVSVELSHNRPDVTEGYIGCAMQGRC